MISKTTHLRNCLLAFVLFVSELVFVFAETNAQQDLTFQEANTLRSVIFQDGIVNAKESQAIIKASNQFASSLASDNDQLFAELMISSRKEALLAKAELNIKGFKDFNKLIRPKRSYKKIIWGLPETNKNYRELVTMASVADSGLYPITGSPGDVRIVGSGAKECQDEFLDCVAVGVIRDGKAKYCCTGTLIEPNVVLTAGHCYLCTGAGANIAVVFVGNKTTGEGVEYLGKTIQHPEYKSNGKANDLALIILDKPVPTEDVKPRRLATKEQIDKAVFGRVVGFGYSDFEASIGFGTKRMVDVPITSHSCSEEYHELFQCDSDKELVAGYLGFGSDTCKGDSGGPLYILIGEDPKDNDSWVLAAATSRALTSELHNVEPAICGDGGIYERVDAFHLFISNAVNP